MKKNDYITILAPMVSVLKLKGNELIIFALVHGFTKDGEHEFSGSLDYIQRWTNLSRPSVLSALAKLTDRGLLNKLEKIINGVKFCSYTTNYDEALEEAEKNLTTGKETLLPVKKIYGGGKETLPNNIDNIDKDICVIAESRKLVKFQPPTYEDVARYRNEHGYDVDPKSFVDFYTSKGWMVGRNKMKDWHAAVRNWDRTQRERRGSGPRSERAAGSRFGTMLKVGAEVAGMYSTATGLEDLPDEQ